MAINIGYMKYANGVLKKCRGKTLPIRVPTSASASLVKEKAVQKHAHHDKLVHDGLAYALLYPDGSEVVNLPGTTEPFLLEKYRDDVGRNYNRISLFIALRSDFQLAEMPDFQDYDESLDSEGETDFSKSAWSSYSDTGNSTPTVVDITGDQPGPASDGKPVESSMAECPTCFQHFPVKLIADHADACGDVWVGELEGVKDTVDDFNQPQESEVATSTSSIPDGLSLTTVIANLGQGIQANRPVKLRVRQKDLWGDVKKVYERGKLSPGYPLKIEFIGEPAVDDGGPLREFFSGNIQALTLLSLTAHHSLRVQLCVYEENVILQKLRNFVNIVLA